MTSGYSATFQKASNVTTSVLDFAKDLLFDLKYAKDQDVKDLDTGKVSQLRSLGKVMVRPGRV
jgi:hypothetical protein